MVNFKLGKWNVKSELINNNNNNNNNYNNKSESPTSECNKHARVLAARQSPKFEKKGGNFVDPVNKKSYELSSLLQFSR